ncbi:MAG: tetratricopeptide repeat protein, partial [Planctomycetales bacterium]|nr:tetratricopeptide repeat protein [Planctomycetales bacterium]
KGDYSGAEPLHRHALAASERVLGPEHPDTLISVNNLALLLSRKGDYVGAEPLFRRALEARERLLGPEHPDTLVSLNNLAGLMSSKGDYTCAEPLFRRALEELMKISASLKRPHPNLQACMENYVGCLAKVGHSPEETQNELEAMMDPFRTSHGEGASHQNAEPSPRLRMVIEQVMRDPLKLQEIAERLEREDPGLFAELVQWVRSQQLVAVIENPQQRLDALRQRATEKERTLGHHHAETISALNGVATQLESMDEFDEAEAEYRKALARAPGDTIVLGNAAVFLQNVRQDFPSARDLFLRALQADPADAINVTNYAGLCLVMGATQEAEQHLRQAWRIVAGKPDGYVFRILFLRAALAETRAEDAALYLGQLKTLFDQGIHPVAYRATSVWGHLQQNLAGEQFALLNSIYTAINETARLVTLSTLPAWQAIPPRPLAE